MKPLMVGMTVLAGAAVLEAALIPGLVIGGAVVLVPRYLPGLRRRLQPTFDAIIGRKTEPAKAARPTTAVEPALPAPDQPDGKPPLVLAGFSVGQAVAKTITFRVIVTSLDFTTNYIVLGELATAAGLSTFSTIAGPLFYFLHETAWNYWGPPERTVDLPALSLPRRDEDASPPDRSGVTISRALAKTITFRTIATVMDFTTNYVVIGDAATAAGLTAFGFVLGPFVYLGHERIWEYYSSPGESLPSLPPAADPLPAAASA